MNKVIMPEAITSEQSLYISRDFGTSTSVIQAIINKALKDLKIDEGLVIVPAELTAENGAKGLLSGEFREEIEGPTDYDDNGNSFVDIDSFPVSWTNIKSIWKMAVEHFTKHVDTDPKVR